MTEPDSTFSEILPDTLAPGQDKPAPTVIPGQAETDFTPSGYVVPGRLIRKNGVRGNWEIPELEDRAVTSTAELDSWLNKHDKKYYTQKRLDSMTKNDKRYAHRVIMGIDEIPATS